MGREFTRILNILQIFGQEIRDPNLRSRIQVYLYARHRDDPALMALADRLEAELEQVVCHNRLL